MPLKAKLKELTDSEQRVQRHFTTPSRHKILSLPASRPSRTPCSRASSDSPPVCGARPPAPAEIQSDTLPSDEQLEAAEKERDRLQESLNQSRQAISAQMTKVESLEAQVREDSESLGSDGEISDETFEAQGVALAKSLETLEAKVGAAKSAETALGQARIKMPQIETDAQNATQARQRAGSSFKSTRHRSMRSMSLPRSFETSKPSNEHSRLPSMTVTRLKTIEDRQQLRSSARRIKPWQHRMRTMRHGA